jgi:hypothetical protein
MAKRTRTQQASHELAQAVFADPALREKFEQMARDTAKREPVPDDFAWLKKPERDVEPPVSRAKFHRDLRRATRPVGKRDRAGS